MGLGNDRKSLHIATSVVLCITLLLPDPASANGAMSLALATFNWIPWMAYVVVTVLFEAWALGRWLKVPVPDALRCSVVANFVTAIIGGVMSGPLSYGFLGIFGSRLNPNPFGQTLFVFTLFGLLSAYVEAHFWFCTKQDLDETVRRGHTLGRCIVIHLIGIPLGLCILLSPSRPYRGLEEQASYRRHHLIPYRVSQAWNDYVEEHNAPPVAHSYEELLELLRPRLEQFANDPGLWAAAYAPNYHRFDTTEMRREPVRWNPRAMRLKPSDTSDKRVWLVRRGEGRNATGIVLQWGKLRRIQRPIDLKYGTDEAPID
jgi:hypothetical protein